MSRKHGLSSEQKIFNFKPVSAIRSRFNASRLKPTAKLAIPHSFAEPKLLSERASSPTTARRTPAFPAAASTLFTAADGYRIALLFLSRGRDQWNAPFNANMIVWQESQAGGMPALGGFQTGTSCRDHRPCPETVNELTFDAAKFRMAVGFPLIRNACLPG